MGQVIHVISQPQLVECRRKYKSNRCEYTYQEPNEVNVIFLTNAVVNPWAVMVESLNTSIACAAVTTAWSSNDQTVWA